MRELTPDIKPQWNAIITDVLREFIKICEENNLTYFCAGGTVLGAVRHQGIIPWDDDIDVNMPRPDFDRFVEICSKRDMGNYELITPHITPNYPFNFFKLCYRNTTIIEHLDIPYVLGLFIDIFPLDGTSDDIDDAYNLMLEYQKVNNRLVAISTRNNFYEYIKLIFTPKHWGRFVYKTIGYFFRNSYRSYLLKKLDAISYMHSYDEAKNVILYCGGYARRDIYPKEWFQVQTELLYEGMNIKVPAQYHDYLSQLYGDYMQLPPVEERGLRHTKAYFNLSEREENIVLK